MTMIISGDNGATFPDSTVQTTTGKTGFVNRIINGAMVIDQRNAGASFTPTDGSYGLDRWWFGLTQASKFTAQQNAGSVTPPSGFNNYLGITSSSAYSIGAGDIFYVNQKIEGYNVADLDFGKSTAKTITLSFWVRSSLTGTFSGAVSNSGTSRTYAFTYTISSANTWEQKTITITGDTTGTWLTTNGTGLYVQFNLACGSNFATTANTWTSGGYGVSGGQSVVGTNGATWYITGVQLEKGSTATSFDYRPYGTELQLCQRYYYYVGGDSTYNYFGIASIISTTSAFLVVYLPVTMRSIPTLSYVGTVGNFDLRASGNAQHFLTAVSQDQSSTKVCGFALYTTGLTANTPGILIPNNSAANQLTFNAEL